MQRLWRSPLFSGAQWQDKRQWTQTKIQKVPPKHQETLLLLTFFFFITDITGIWKMPDIALGMGGPA